MVSASFSPDSRRVVTASDDGAVRVWDLESRTEIVLLKGHQLKATCASFSPDGHRIVTASHDGTARVWDAKSGGEIAVLKGLPPGRWASFPQPVVSASFSNDGRRVVTVSDDGVARVWDVSRTESIVHERAVLLVVALARRVGRRTDNERTDLLMQDADDDLHAEALKQLGRPNADRNIAGVAAALSAPLHPNCYLSPTQLLERLRLRPTRHVAVVAPAAGT
jgi:dipeptidyl aminopeptidase/acylaminoacyl peptidase